MRSKLTNDEKKDLIKQVFIKKEQGISITKACEELKIKKSNYAYWKDRFEDEIKVEMRGTPTIHESIPTEPKKKKEKFIAQPTGKVAIIFCNAHDVGSILAGARL